MKVIDYQQCSNKIICERIKYKPVDILITQVYMPTSTYKDCKVGRVYEEIEEVLEYLKGADNLILMEDRNAVVGERKE